MSILKFLFLMIAMIVFLLDSTYYNEVKGDIIEIAIYGIMLIGSLQYLKFYIRDFLLPLSLIDYKLKIEINSYLTKNRDLKLFFILGYFFIALHLYSIYSLNINIDNFRFKRMLLLYFLVGIIYGCKKEIECYLKRLVCSEAERPNQK